MIWYVVTILVVLVLGVVAAGAAGRGGTMPEAFDDRVDSRVPAGTLDAADVAAVRLPVAVRGYRMQEVDALLDVLGTQIAEQQATIARLEVERSTASTPAGSSAAEQSTAAAPAGSSAAEVPSSDESDELPPPGHAATER